METTAAKNERKRKEKEGILANEALNKDTSKDIAKGIEKKAKESGREPNANDAWKILKGSKKKVIMIPATEAPGGKDDVTVAVAGVVYKIKRGYKVRVPVQVVEVLEHAVADVYTQRDREDGSEGMEMVKSTAMRYPFQMYDDGTEPDVELRG